MLGVVGEELQGHAFQSGLRGIDLGQDVDAVAVFVDHLLDATNLTLDPPKARLDRSLVFGVTWHTCMIPTRGICLQNTPVTTITRGRPWPKWSATTAIASSWRRSSRFRSCSGRPSAVRSCTSPCRRHSVSVTTGSS